jgi:hypothetical protein
MALWASPGLPWRRLEAPLHSADGISKLFPQAMLVPGIVATLGEWANSELKAYYTAAIYLQIMWRIRLARYLPAMLDLANLLEMCIARRGSGGKGPAACT